MVPEVDKRDTELLLREQREILEATRQEILNLEMPDGFGEKLALQKLAARSAQQGRQWVGQMLGELGTTYPYANSLNPENQTIDPTTVSAKTDYFLVGKQSLVSRIKFARLTLQGVDKALETMLAQCKPYTRFNQFLFKVQEHAMQSKMWLGELLNELREEEPVAPSDTVHDSQTEAQSTPTQQDLVNFQSIKDELVGEPGTAEREQYETELASEIAELRAKEQSSEALAAGESVSPSTENNTEPASTSGSDSKPGSDNENVNADPGTNAGADQKTKKAGKSVPK